MLNVRVMFNGVAYYVMHVVTSLPPCNAHPPKDVANEETDEHIPELGMGDSIVTSVMTDESKLLPE